MASLLGLRKRPKYEHNFHDDKTLHDSSAEALPFSWKSDAISAAKFGWASIFDPKESASLAKQELPNHDVNAWISKKVTKQMVSMLWGSMPHPPLSYRGSELQYRTPDGSYNNIMYPDLGKAGLPYARTLPPKRPLHGAKPDPGDLFDLLMARNDNGVESASGISSMLLYHADIIIHDIFRTADGDTNLSATSSYLDLAPLYGNSKAEQHTVRRMDKHDPDGLKGLLKPDTFHEERLLNQPPGVCIYLIMYNRFHNYVAQQLLEINENGKFDLPVEFAEMARKPIEERDFKGDKEREKKFYEALGRRDEDLFQTARLVTCGLYINIAIHDYLRCLMLMHEKDTPWTLDPRPSYSEPSNQRGLQRGEGNMVSVEFNLMYRFHSPLSERDRQWSDAAFETLLSIPSKANPPGKPYIVPDNTKVSEEDILAGKRITRGRFLDGDVPVPKLVQVLKDLREGGKNMEGDRAKLEYFPKGLDLLVEKGQKGDDKKEVGKTLYAFKRDPTTGKFDDAQLVAEMIRVIEDPINHFGAQNVPKVFKQIEILGILQARKWEVATLNEFRQFFGLSRHESFEDINSDPVIQNALRDMYEDPDLVELYPGVMCEGNGRNLDPGSSCPNNEGSALWRCIFSDAVTLVRSDRFYTLDWNVGSLTAWGMKEVSSDPKVNKGSVFHRLFQRAFPGYFTYNSIHMWQPFYTPTKNAILAREQGYINFLDLRELEVVDRNSDRTEQLNVTNGDIQFDFRGELWQDPAKPPTKVLRKALQGEGHPVWRGRETATLTSKPKTISKYDQIKRILRDPAWINPAMLQAWDVPTGNLRDLLTNQWRPWNDVLQIIETYLPSHDSSSINAKFMAYFVGISEEIRTREERHLQCLKGKTPKERNENTGKPEEEAKYKVKQIDIVKDYAIPVVTRFVADFLGFWESVKTSEAPNREYDENQIYQLIQNCQSFETYDSDRTKTWEHRIAYKDSIHKLKTLTEKGVFQSEAKYFEGSFLPIYYRSYASHSEQEYVTDIRKLAVGLIQALRRKYTHDQVVAIMLSIALDATQDVVLMFTEALAYFIDPVLDKKVRARTPGSKKRQPQVKLWTQVQNLALENTDTDDKILRNYVIEAHRCTNKRKVVRVYNPQALPDTATTENSPRKRKRAANDLARPSDNEDAVQFKDPVLLDFYTASHDGEVFPEPDDFNHERTEEYLIYGKTNSPPQSKNGRHINPEDNRNEETMSFSKKLGLIAVTGMIKHAASLKNLRVAHDKLGRLKKVRTPEGSEKYCNTQWNQLLPSPATWNLRFDGIGPGVFAGTDNADQGHGMDQTLEL